MRVTSLAAIGAAIGLTVAAGSAGAQSPTTRTVRTVQVPADAVVLVLPGMPPGVMAVPAQRLEAGLPIAMTPTGMAGLDAAFRQMDAQLDAQIDAQMDRMMAMATSGFAVRSPDRMIPAALGNAPLHGSSVVVTSFSDGRHSCTQRMTYAGNGAAPVVQTSGDACGAVPAGLPTPAAGRDAGRAAGHDTGHGVVSPLPSSPRLIEAARRPAAAPPPVEVADLAR